MSAESAVLAGRVLAEAQMVDSCTIDRATGTATDPNTGKVTPTYTVVYQGRCRVQQVGTQGLSPNAGEHEYTVMGHVLQLPIDTTVYRVGDRATIDTATLDPALVGRVFSVTSLMHKTHPTARRLVCEEVLA